MPRFDVTIAGELNLDLILYGLPDELPPERELLADRMMLTLGSSSAIVAHNLASLGSRVGFQSLIGDDSLGQIALDRLAEGGVDISRVRQVHGSTTTGLTIILQRTRLAQHADLLRHHRGTFVAAPRLRLSFGFPSLPSFVALSAASLAA